MREPASPPPFAFFLGAGRSGTTLVQAIFDSHPALAVAHEARFVALFARRDYGLGASFATERFVADVTGHRNFRHLQLESADVAAALRDAAPTTYAAAVRAVFALFASRRHKTRYGDKTPAYVLHIDTLARLFPEARFVHVIRDGRDSALSYLDRRRGPADIGANALNWRARVTRGRAAGSRLGPDRYRELRYEDLIASPEATLRPLCQFLDLAFDDAMLRYYERAVDVTAPIVNPERFEHLHRPPTSGLRDWRTEMSPADVTLFEAIAGPLLTELGYERVTSGSTTRIRARATAASARWQLRRLSAAFLPGRARSRRVSD